MLAKAIGISKLPQPLSTADSPGFAGLTVSGLAASRLVATSGASALQSAALVGFVGGTANQIAVADNGSGGVTLSLPQSIATSSYVNFARLGAGTAPSYALHVLAPDGDANLGVFFGNLTGTVSMLLANNAANSTTNAASFAIHLKTTTALRTAAHFKASYTVTTDATRTSKVNISACTDGVLDSVLTLLGGNVGCFGAESFGASAKGVLALANGTAPTGDIANQFALYAADITAGQSAPHFRTENGKVIKLYQQAHIADPTGGATVDSQARAAVAAILVALETLGLTATS